MLSNGKWIHDMDLDWSSINYIAHTGVQRLIRDLNRLYVSEPALRSRDCEASGFQWVIGDDRSNSVFFFCAWRPIRGKCWWPCNMTPVPRHAYRARRFTVRATGEKSSIPIFECLLGYNLLQVLRLAPELLDLISRCGPRRVAGQPRYRPPEIPSTKSNTCSRRCLCAGKARRLRSRRASAIEHNADLLFRCVVLPGCPPDVADKHLGRRRGSLRATLRSETAW